MHTRPLLFPLASALLLALSCQEHPSDNKNAALPPGPGTFAYDDSFLSRYTQNLVVLKDPSGTARVLVSPEYQGRVMTSSAMGDSGTSFGWLNYALLESEEKKKQFNPVGGEERFWLGPEGGQYALYFRPGDPFDINHWQVPPLIDTDTFTIAEKEEQRVLFVKDASVINYAGTELSMHIEREIILVPQPLLEQQLGVALPGTVHAVAYQSRNRLTNTGGSDWNKKTGLPSIWLLSMMTPSEETTVIIPFHPSVDARKGITDDYFGAISPERLRISDSVLYFTCDGKMRGKLGIAPEVARGLAGSFDFRRNILTLIFFPVSPGSPYVNSKWEIQQEPYGGDVVNAYNDGPLADGTQLGPFYELESSSPALALSAGSSYTYVQTVCHLEGSYEALRQIALQVLGVDLNNVQ